MFDTLEQAKRQYLAQWRHAGCGGQPVAYVEAGDVGCTRCGRTWNGAGTLGEVMEGLTTRGDFRSMVVR